MLLIATEIFLAICLAIMTALVIFLGLLLACLIITWFCELYEDFREERKGRR